MKPMFKSPSRIASSRKQQRRTQKETLKLIILVTLVVSGLLLIAKQWQGNIEPLINLVPTASQQPSRANKSLSTAPIVTKADLRAILSEPLRLGALPSHLQLNDQVLAVKYTLDSSLQEWAMQRLQRYNPDYGVFVAIEPDTGEILALATNRRDQQPSADLALRATYPAASTFKIITAAAAIEEGLAKTATVYAFNGKSTSLYKHQVFQTKQNKWTRRMSLKTAFAKSANPIFGRIGAKVLGAETLLDYAQRFGYNAQFISDIEFDNGQMEIDLNDPWQAAEAASGYTRRNTLSPIHGAVIAATIANGGKLVSPHIVKTVSNDKEKILYAAKGSPSIDILSQSSASAMQNLMQATISQGTGKKSFQSFTRKNTQLTLGGKSGHLRGESPKGSYDWFIGYGQQGERKIAYAMLCINKEKWYVKSSRFAREAMAYYFSPKSSSFANQKNSTPTTPIKLTPHPTNNPS